MNEKIVKICSDCVDIQVDADKIYVKKLINNGANLPTIQYS